MRTWFTWLSVATLIASSGCDAGGESADPAEQFEGTWNYDLPDLATGRNVATLRCPAAGDGFEQRLTLPQLGSLTLRSIAPDRLEGVTDQGCRWTFAAEGASLELSPAGQSCHNPVFDLDYTIERWTLDREGDLGHERVVATSENEGQACSFELAEGLRSRITEDGGDPAARFAGRWNHVAPEPESGINFAQVFCPRSGETPTVRIEPVGGALEVARTGANTARATDPEGCDWTFDVRGGTAWLSPAPQRCAAPDGSIKDLSFWSFAVESDHGFEIMSGARTAGAETCGYVVGAGELRRDGDPRPLLEPRR